jgi:hypothetical protein
MQVQTLRILPAADKTAGGVRKFEHGHPVYNRYPMPAEELQSGVVANKAPQAERIDYTTWGAMCRGCGYLLRELPEDRCPECGSSFDRHDPETMKVPGYRRPVEKPPPRPFGQDMIAASTMATFLAIAAAQCAGVLWFFVIIVWPAILIAWVRRNRLPQDHPERAREIKGPNWRRWVKVMFLISFLGNLRFNSCPHATTVWVGPWGISHSEVGGPCRNPPHNGGYHLIGNLYIAK